MEGFARLHPTTATTTLHPLWLDMGFCVTHKRAHSDGCYLALTQLSKPGSIDWQEGGLAIEPMLQCRMQFVRQRWHPSVRGSAVGCHVRRSQALETCVCRVATPTCGSLAAQRCVVVLCVELGLGLGPALCLLGNRWTLEALLAVLVFL
jgi:hypothetical protein